MILAKRTRGAIRSKLLLECRYYSGKSAPPLQPLLVSQRFLPRPIVPGIFIADQRIQGISLALDLLRDTELAHHGTRGFTAPR